MIRIEDVSKRYQTDKGPSDWVLKNINLEIPTGCNVGLIGRNGAGKSTLLRLIGGLDHPTSGKITKTVKLSWPMGFRGGMKGTLTGRQNATFILRIHGIAEEDLPEKLKYMQDFAELGKQFDDKFDTYSSGMRSRLNFGLSLACDFDVYLADEVLSVGDAAFRKKAAATFLDKAGKTGLILVSHSESTLLQFCSAGIYLNQGQAHWFDDIKDALSNYNKE